MPAERGYDVFPRTFKARLLLAAAFLGGLALTAGPLADDERLFSRTRRLVTKYIGLMFYGLPLSDDPKSPMYGKILSVSDLDKMEEPLFIP